MPLSTFLCIDLTSNCHVPFDTSSFDKAGKPSLYSFRSVVIGMHERIRVNNYLPSIFKKFSYKFELLNFLQSPLVENTFEVITLIVSHNFSLFSSQLYHPIISDYHCKDESCCISRIKKISRTVIFQCLCQRFSTNIRLTTSNCSPNHDFLQYPSQTKYPLCGGRRGI